MNIILCVNSFLPVLGGKEFVVHHLANALTALGHRARVVGPTGFWKHRHMRLNYPVHRWPTLRGALREPVDLARLGLDAALWGADVIHAHNTYPSAWSAVRLKRLRNYPLVITPHGADIQTIPEIGHGLRLDPALDKKIVYALGRAERITAISNNIEKVILETGVARDRVRLIPNGVDIARFDRPPSDSIRDWLGVAADARLLVTIGRYNPRKGQDYLVRAMPAVLQAEPRARLVIVGNATEALNPLIERLGLGDKVVLTGGITPTSEILLGSRPGSGDTPDYLAELLCSSELYVSAGIQNNAEGLSLAVLEAMAARLPVVATAISGNTDVVTDGRNGCLVKAADEQSLATGILNVLSSQGLQDDMRRSARATAEGYAWLNIARRYAKVYEEAIGECRA